MAFLSTCKFQTYFFVRRKNLFDITLRWSMHLISVKGLVVYILKKCENKIIYIKYKNVSSNVL
jgi:hypothetical protein